MSWCKKNIQERWDKRYTPHINDEHDDGVLVLKTRFNHVWNWFSAIELGKTVTEYWQQWYERAAEGNYSNDPSRPYPPYRDEEPHDLTDVAADLVGTRASEEDVPDVREDVFVPDLGKIGILGRRWIVSRKRTTNLFDLANAWKKAVFQKLDEELTNNSGIVSSIQSSEPVASTSVADRSQTTPSTHMGEDEEEIIYPHYYNRSPTPEIHPEFGRLAESYQRR
ncbi:hypothetical protein BDQ17DRAFT_1466349 [Cyathus striatus]|nr:hypothetical protein BDQ17DRAFT_1466349 [Cyathus striatus]